MKPRRKQKRTSGIATRRNHREKFKSQMEEYHERRSGVKPNGAGWGSLAELEAKLNAI